MLAFILGPIWETSWRQSLVISEGKFSIFLEKPISCGALVFAAFLIITSGLKYYKKTKTQVIVE
jgi:putative tricarboxylic transport membrane protein